LTEKENQEKLKEQLVKAWQNDPVVRHDSFSDKRLWGKQEEILHSVRDNKKTTVKSGNTIGKSFIASDTCMDFLTIYGPEAKVITTAPTWTQVEGIIWKEIASYCNKSKIPIGAEPLKTELNFSGDWFARGISTNEVHRLQGFHSPRLLVVIDEASGVAPEIWEAVEALHPYRVLAIGNPNEIVGNFYDTFSSSLWNKLTVSCQDCVDWQDIHGAVPGLVTQEWINERAEEWGRKSPLFDIHCLGEFPLETADTLISRGWLERARKGLDIENKPLDIENKEDTRRVIACDVATKHGECETVFIKRYGHTVESMTGHYRIPTTDIADKLAFSYSEYKPHNLVVDSDGIGEGVSDILTSRRVPVTEFHGGYGYKAIDNNRYKNLRSQFYWIVAKKFEKGLYNLSLLGDKEYEILKNQLCSIKTKAPDSMGRIQIETKDDLRARQIKSPDYADAFVYGEFGFWSSHYQEIAPVRYR